MNGNDQLLFQVLVRLGPVFSGIKPAELLNIKKGQTLNNLQKGLAGSSKIKYIEIRDFDQPARRQVLFYHVSSLSRVLHKQSVSNFLSHLGYPAGACTENYVQFLTARLTSDHFPHEVGIFLGYPLKDVLGYMGIIPLKTVKIKGWRYFGNGRKSEELYTNFLKCRQLTRIFLLNMEELFSRSE
ncbi:MAG: DUF3793 family protein [Peptococcaceae bacterium]